MGIQNWSDNIILVNLSCEPTMGEELQSTVEQVQGNTNFSVVVDFSDVDIVTSSSLAKLLKLRKTLRDQHHELILCCVKPRTMQIFEVAGLDTVFEFAEEQFLALAGLQLVK